MFVPVTPREVQAAWCGDAAGCSGQGVLVPRWVSLPKTRIIDLRRAMWPALSSWWPRAHGMKPGTKTWSYHDHPAWSFVPKVYKIHPCSWNILWLVRDSYAQIRDSEPVSYLLPWEVKPRFRCPTATKSHLISILHVPNISRGAPEPARLAPQDKPRCRALLCPLFTFFPGIGIN